MNNTFPFQNPLSPAPDAILQELKILEVEHYGFDNTTHSGEIIVHKDLLEDVKGFFEFA